MKKYDLSIKGPVYRFCMQTRPSGAYSICNTFGLSVWLLDGAGDECIAAYACIGEGYYHAHKHKIHYSEGGRPFIRKGGVRYYFDEIMRV